MYDEDNYIKTHQSEVSVQASAFQKKYGSDFNQFFYRPNLDTFLKDEVLRFKNPDIQFSYVFDNDHWNSKHPFNFPGPFYTGESDTCCTGDREAPDNVMYDDYGCEFIFKQPQSFAEFLSMVDAAEVEVFDSYSCNGNNYWTYQLCKEWWQNKNQLLHELNTKETRKVNGNRVLLYVNYLNGNAKSDLSKYCYYLENGAYPSDGIKNLPDL